jgi:glutamate-1-semialdehyde aminotransferase/spore coat polysaccharide biosynthesis protein SpsF (cytidylyltransferase family)
LKIIALVQARMGSTRLPGKVMKTVVNSPVIELLLKRLSLSKRINQIILATSQNPENGALVEHVSNLGFTVFQGNENDVLDRFYQASKIYQGDIIVRITGDCPFVDPVLVDSIIDKFIEGQFDYFTNTLPPTFPDGLDVEVFSFEVLEKATIESSKSTEREHVTPYLRNSNGIKKGNYISDSDYSNLRWTLDEYSDLEFINEVFEKFKPNIHFSWKEILKLIHESPGLNLLNQHIMRNEGYLTSKLNEIELRKNVDFTLSNQYRASIHHLIPGGSHTYSKGDDQFPILSPAAIDFGKGSHIWDVDGNEYLDCSMGLTSISLGHAYPSVVNAVASELQRGVNFQRPSILEKEMAEKFLEIVPQHDMIKFAKNGSIVTTAAVKLARAFTGRKLVAFPGDHPFYSYDDWFIGTTACSKGVPDEFSELSVKFKSCNIESLKQLFEQHPGQIACVITEPEKSTCTGCNCGQSPEVFLKEAIELAHKNGALFIIDEMVTGFKTDFPGSMTKYGLKPDMATWGKGIANGFSFCALTGTKEIMELGGINRPGEEKVFLISTTHGGETHALSAAMTTIKEFQESNVISHIHTLNKLLASLCKKLTNDIGLSNNIDVIECEWMPTFIFRNAEGEVCQGFRTLFMQEMIRNGVLFQGIFTSCYSHTEDDIYYFIKAFEASLKVYQKALKEGFRSYLVGEPAKAVFRRVL